MLTSFPSAPLAGGLLKHDHSKWLRQCEQTFRETATTGGLSHLAFCKKLALESQSGMTSSPVAILTGDLSRSSISLSAGHQSSDEESSTSSETLPKECTNVAEAVDASSCSGKKSAPKPKPEKIIMPTPAQLADQQPNGSKQVTRDLLSFEVEEEEEEDLSARDVLHSSSDPGLSLEEFIQYMNAKGRKGLYEEYNMIKSKQLEGTFECARQRENQLKNRYTDVLCFDHSRVRLPSSSGDEAEQTDYINAN